MPLKKTLLYPFYVNSPYFEGYAWAVELALRMKAKLQLFTSTTIPSGATIPADSIYHSLLEAHGYYLEHYKNPDIKLSDISRKPNITNGLLKDELISYLRKNRVDIVIIDPLFLSAQIKEIPEIEKQAKGLIFLPERKSFENISAQPLTDHFYDVLQRSELYKLPENFFVTMGNDLTVFNYLRKFFQKR